MWTLDVAKESSTSDNGSSVVRQNSLLNQQISHVMETLNPSGLETYSDHLEIVNIPREGPSVVQQAQVAGQTRYGVLADLDEDGQNIELMVGQLKA